MSDARAVRYRRLARAEKDDAKAQLLFKLADECERGILCTARPSAIRPQQIDPKPKPRNFKMWLAD
jgi:hypothetical protein